MIRFASAMLLAAAVSLGAYAEEKKPGTILEGEWKVTSVIKEGKPEDKITDSKLTVAGNKMTVRDDGHDEPAAFTHDPKATPASIDLQPLDKEGKPIKKGEKEVIVKGIYKVEKDVLTLCFALDGGQRPKEFKGEKATVLLVLEKVKK